MWDGTYTYFNAANEKVDELLEQGCTGILFTYLEDFGAEFRD